MARETAKFRLWGTLWITGSPVLARRGAELMETQGDVTASEIVSACFYFSKLLQLIVVAEVETRSGTSDVIQ